MAKYVFPAVFEKDGDGYFISFPDIDGCFTQGNDLTDGLEMAEDVLCMTLYDTEEAEGTIPQPTQPTEVSVSESGFVTLVGCDTMEYRKFHENRAVKKTLTIPKWLDEMASRENVNFSGVLQEALKEKLQLNNH